jgi:hypothetical protein
MECSVQGRWKTARDMKNKVKSMLIIFFDIKGLFTKNSSWQTKQSFPHITVTFLDDCMRTCEDFALNFFDKRTNCCITTTHHLTLPFSPGNYFTKNNMTVVSHPPCLSVFPIEDTI